MNADDDTTPAWQMSNPHIRVTQLRSDVHRAECAIDRCDRRRRCVRPSIPIGDRTYRGSYPQDFPIYFPTLWTSPTLSTDLSTDFPIFAPFVKYLSSFVELGCFPLNW